MPARAQSDLKSKAVRGGIITMSAQMASVLIQLASLVVLSRLLTPEDFGVIAMITAITALMGLFRDMGLSTAAVQKGDLTYQQTNSLFWLNTGAGGILTVLVVALSPAVAWFYKDPKLQPVTALLACTFVISGIGGQHAALLQRELRFKQKAIAEISGALCSMSLAISLAVLGLRYWALAWGTLVGALVTTSLYFTFSKFRPSSPRGAKGIRELIGFGAHVTGFELVNYFHRNLDNVLIGRFWGAMELGFYSRAYQMMMLPINSLRTPINAVAFPVLSRLKDNPSEFRRYYCRISSLLALTSMPLMAFLTANAHDVVRVTLGARWAAVAPIFILLGITGFIQPIASLRGLVMLSTGRSARYLAWGVANAIAVSVAFCIGTIWGSIGVAVAYAVSNYLILYPSLTFAFKDTPLRPADFFLTAAFPAFASISSAAVGRLASNQFAIENPFASLASSLSIFCAVFAAICVVVPSGRRMILSYRNLAFVALRKRT